METLFYSPTEKIAFYIPNYYPDSACGATVNGIIKMLREEYNNFANMLPNRSDIEDNICTYEILKSSRYKHMRVWYVGCEACPNGAFKLGPDWTMNKWITN